MRHSLGLSSSIHLQPTKQPQLDRGASVQRTRTPEIAHICRCKCGGTGTPRGVRAGGTVGAGPVMPELLSHSPREPRSIRGLCLHGSGPLAATVTTATSSGHRPCGPSTPGSSVHGTSQARTLDWVAIPSSRGPSWPRDWTGSPALQADSLPSESQGSPLATEVPTTPASCPQWQFSSVQSLSHVHLFATPWIVACQASLSITNSWSSLKYKWGLPKLIQGMLPHSKVTEEALWTCKEQSEQGNRIAQIAEVHMEGMDSLSPEACTFPYIAC